MKQKHWLGILSVFFLTACGVTADRNQRTLEETTLQGTAFTKELTKQYYKLSVYESDLMYDWVDADRFSEKALESSRGKIVMPENPAQWKLPDNKRPELQKAHDDLVTTLNNGARERTPIESAHAQAALDCWIEQQQENWQKNHISTCRNAFYAAFNDVTNHEKANNGDATSAQYDITSSTYPEIEEIYFEFDSVEISSEAMTQLNRITQKIKKSDTEIIVIDGHADKSGSTTYNYTLSENRARSIRNTLVDLGVSANKIKIHAYGEGQPAVKTDDGVSEKGNRRVVITYQKTLTY